jgi:hypothetical protein
MIRAQYIATQRQHNNLHNRRPQTVQIQIGAVTRQRGNLAPSRTAPV